jgi:sec-independent protein translocase protein TatC
MRRGLFSNPKMPTEEEKLDLVEHLEELRTRIIRCIIYVVIGFAAGWMLYGHIYRLLMAPLVEPIQEAGGQIVLRAITEGFFTRFTVSAVAGIIIAVPGILYELWAFVAPGLTRDERRAAAPLIPGALGLFAAGVAVGYLITPRFVRWMLSPAFRPEGVGILPTMQSQIAFLAKLYLAFGLCFQLPIVLLFLIKAGVVSPEFLAARRKEAFIGILIVAAVVTPTWDVVTLSLLAVPMLALYEGTIWFARISDWRRRKAAEAEGDEGEAPAQD